MWCERRFSRPSGARCGSLASPKLTRPRPGCGAGGRKGINLASRAARGRLASHFLKARGGSTMREANQRGVTAIVAILIGIAGLSYLVTRAAAPAAAETTSAPAAMVEFTADGKLKQPVGYRKWVYVGTPLTPNDLNGGEAPFPEFHSVYMDPESFAHYEKTGKFRDGAVMVKELVSVGSKKATSGNGYFMGEFTG